MHDLYLLSAVTHSMLSAFPEHSPMDILQFEILKKSSETRNLPDKNCSIILHKALFVLKLIEISRYSQKAFLSFLTRSFPVRIDFPFYFAFFPLDSQQLEDITASSWLLQAVSCQTSCCAFCFWLSKLTKLGWYKITIFKNNGKSIDYSREPYRAFYISGYDFILIKNIFLCFNSPIPFL